jgi:drug/metabolite transporter (DMT)-like permease
VIAILGGLGAAFAWGAATLCSSHSTREVGPFPVLAWVMVVGLIALAPVLAVGPGPGPLTSTDVAWLVVGGVGNVAGLLLEYTGLRFGKVGVVAPIASTEGAIAATIAILAGETLSAAVALALAVIVAGVVLTSRPAAEEGFERGSVGHRDARIAALCGVGAALSFGVSLYGIGRLSGDLPAVWLMLPARLAGTIGIALPLLLVRRLALPRAVVPFVVVAGLCEVIGFASYTAGAQHGIAIAAVLSSQFAAVAAVAAYFAFRERLARHQVAGVAAIIAGVAVLSVLQAG